METSIKIRMSRRAQPITTQKIIVLLFFFLVKTVLASKPVTRPPLSKSLMLMPPFAALAGSFLGGGDAATGAGAAGAGVADGAAPRAAGAPGTSSFNSILPNRSV